MTERKVQCPYCGSWHVHVKAYNQHFYKCKKRPSVAAKRR